MTSVYTMTGISLQRLVAVKFPLKYKINTKRPYLFLIPTWLIGIIIAGSRFGASSWASKKLFTIVVFFLVYIIPLVCIVICYVIVWTTLANKRLGSETSSLSATVNQTIVITIVSFMACWTPFMVLNVVWVFNYPIPVWVAPVVMSLRYTNSIVNFFVYATKIREFRIAVRSLVCSTT